MRRVFLLVLLCGSLAGAQDAGSPNSATEALPSDPELSGKVSLVRGVLTRVDAIHDQLLVRTFGGGSVRIAFDTRTQLIRDQTPTRLTTIPAGSTVSIDTLIEKGKLFARSVRIDAAAAGELNGQVVRYDAAKSQLTLRDPMSPENISLHLPASAEVIRQGQPTTPQVLLPGMLVRVRFSPSHHDASHVEILAERGNDFTFTGKILSVDLRARTLALSNDSDQSVRELAIGSLDPTSLRLLRDGTDVNIKAEFDGDRYNARSVTLVTRSP